MAIPGHIIYLITIRLIQWDDVTLTVPFVSTYLLVAVIQVSILLYIAHVLVPFLWSKKIDPDNSAIPGQLKLKLYSNIYILCIKY